MSNVIIIGCGRVGSQLANLLSDNGDNVCCIDRSADAFANLGSSFSGSTVQGMGFDEDVLERAGINDCDVLAAVTQHDNTNLMCAEVAGRLYDVPLVIARLYNPDHENAYAQIGIDYVCGTSLVADEIFSKIVSSHGSHVATFGDCEIVEFSLNLDAKANADRRSIRVGDLEREHELRVVAFERADGSASSIPNEESVLYNGDIVLACVKIDSIRLLNDYIQR